MRKRLLLTTVFIYFVCLLGFGQQKFQLSKSQRVTELSESRNSKETTKSKTDNFANNKAASLSKGVNQEPLAPRPDEEDVKSPFDAVKGKREDLSKRDMFSKHFINDDGNFTALVGAGPIHYEKNGNWEDINHQIISNNNTEFPYGNTTNLMESYFGASANSGVISKTKEGEVKEFLNTKMYWQVNGQNQVVLNATNSPITLEDDKAFYNNIYGDIDAEFTILTGKRKLNYIVPNIEALGNIPNNADYLVFSEDILLPNGWTHAVDEKKGILVKDATGTVVYAYQNPLVYEDYNGELFKPEKNNPASFEVTKTGNTLTILLKVKTDWLQDASRVFPLAIDPTVVVNPNNAAFWSGWVDEDGFGGNDIMYVGYYGGAENDAFIRFNLSTIPINSDVTAVTSSLYRYGIVGNSVGSTNTMTIGTCTTDPLTATYWIDIYNGYTGNISNTISIKNTNNYKTNTFTPAGIAYVEAALTNGFTTILAWPSGTWNGTNYAGFDGYSGQNVPYLTITYTVCATVTASASQVVICEGDTTTLSATSSGSYTYTWYDDWDENTQTGNIIG